MKYLLDIGEALRNLARVVAGRTSGLEDSAKLRAALRDMAQRQEFDGTVICRLQQELAEARAVPGR